MDLEANNPYKKQLLEIMKNHKEGKLTDINTYLRINEIITKYDFDVIMPYEQKIIEERRKQESEKSCELLSDIPIQNPEDITEVAVKTKIQIGQILQKGYNEYYRTIRIENLNMKDRKGNTLTKLSGGKQKAKAQEIIKQYTEIINKPDANKYAIQIADIYIEPLLTVFDGRGKHSSGYYIKRLTPLIIDRLIFIDEHIQYTNISQIARNIGLVDKKYRNMKYDELAEINPKFTIKMVNDFYGNANRELEKIILRFLITFRTTIV